MILSNLINNPRVDSASKNEVCKLSENFLNAGKVTPIEDTLDNDKNQCFNVPISLIPDLEKYLEEETDKKTELERIQIEFLNYTIL